jgi:CRP-like cAMP-binding protein
LKLANFSKDEVIYEKYEEADSMYIIRSGSVELTGATSQLGTEKTYFLEESAYFGESIYNANYTNRFNFIRIIEDWKVPNA